MNMTELTERVQDWVDLTLNNIENPEWYHHLKLKTWPTALQSSIGFLAGHFPGKINIYNVNVYISV